MVGSLRRWTLAEHIRWTRFCLRWARVGHQARRFAWADLLDLF